MAYYLVISSSRHLFICSALLILVAARPARGQDPPPKIGPFVVDVHGTVPSFPQEEPLAASRELALAELPGHGFGAQVAATVYFLRWRAVTVGIGGEVAAGRAHNTPPPPATADAIPLRPVEERFRSAGSQLSFNFGNGNGWSYISGGIGQSTWSVIPDGGTAVPSDVAHLKTINYGGGARWFDKKHVAFSFDVRFYAINPGPPNLADPGGPRTTLLVIGAGVSLK